MTPRASGAQSVAHHRIAVVGIGIVSPLGDDASAYFAALFDGRSAIGPIAEGVVGARCDFDGNAFFTRSQRLGLDRVSLMAVVAAENAVADARRAAPLEWSVDRVGIYCGTGFGGAGAVEEGYRRYYHDELVPPLTVLGSMANAPAAAIAIRAGITGPALTYSVACASSSIAIACGAKDIVAGEVDIAIVGGSEALLTDSMIAAWQAMRTLATPLPGRAGQSCRPFSKTRSGLALGEGAAFLVLERLESAVSRGAHVYAEFAGSGIAGDASHLAKPAADGQVAAMRKALASAGLRPSDIDYCNAHGTATTVGDTVEADAIGRVWNHAFATLQVGSTKALHGHLLGAAGALEAVTTVMAIDRQRVPPTFHCEDPDPDCAIPLATSSDTTPIRAAISNSFAFGGTNSVLVFKRFEIA